MQNQKRFSCFNYFESHRQLLTLSYSFRISISFCLLSTPFPVTFNVIKRTNVAVSSQFLLASKCIHADAFMTDIVDEFLTCPKNGVVYE